MKIQTILLSNFPLPYQKIGSWTTLYHNYITSAHNQIDYIICKEPDSRYEHLSYVCVKTSFSSKIKAKFSGTTKGIYINALKEILKSNNKFVIQIVDDFNLATAIIKLLKFSEYRNNCYLQFFYHGYSPVIPNGKAAVDFFENLDEVVLLTHTSYKAFKEYYTQLPCRISVLHNGIDTKKFFPISEQDKFSLREKYGFSDKKVFVWCSQDRPKKGLFIALEAFQKIHSSNPNSELWVIGTNQRQAIEGVRFLGKLPNSELPKYFQMADIYLFPTLCQEGFGLSLIEAMHCGCYCIASNNGGVGEVLEFGQYGELIENPNFVSEWVLAMQKALAATNYPYERISPDKYSANSWNQGMNDLILNAKFRLNLLKS